MPEKTIAEMAAKAALQDKFSFHFNEGSFVIDESISVVYEEEGEAGPFLPVLQVLGFEGEVRNLTEDGKTVNVSNMIFWAKLALLLKRPLSIFILDYLDWLPPKLVISVKDGVVTKYDIRGSDETYGIDGKLISKKPTTKAT